MNQLESWIYLEIGKLEFIVVFATFVHVASFFEQSSHLHVLARVFAFSHISVSCCHCPYTKTFSFEFFVMCNFLALSLPFWFFQFCCVNRFLVSNFIHITSVAKSLFLLIIWHNFLIVWTKCLDHFNYFYLAIIDCNI